MIKVYYTKKDEYVLAKKIFSHSVYNNSTDQFTDNPTKIFVLLYIDEFDKSRHLVMEKDQHDDKLFINDKEYTFEFINEHPELITDILEREKEHLDVEFEKYIIARALERLP